MAIVYFSPKNTDIFSELSKTFENIVFLYTYSNEILLNYGAVEDDIVMFKHFDEKKVDFGGKINRNSLQRWIQETSKPYVRPYDDETSAYVFEKLHPAIFFFRYEGEAQDYDDFFHKLAREFKDDLVFTYADLSLPEYRKLSQFMGVPRHAMPTFTIIDFLDDGLNKYLYFRAPNESDVKNFIIQWKNKEIKPFVKSEATPDKPYVNGVLTVVANTFEELVIDIDKDVLVEFWVPWSEMCRKIAKDYEELARTYQDDGNIIIARVDGNLNDVKGHYIQEYPTFKFFPRHQKSGILFTGDPSLASLNQFILDHTQPNRRIDL